MTSKKTTTKKAMKAYSIEEVSKHNTQGDLWIIVEGKVIDMSTYDHPGSF